jgi:hypothetical protein
MEAYEIEKYLKELGAELKGRGIKETIRIMLIGGAYMLLLANSPRPTEDIDFLWLEEEVFQQTFSQKLFSILNDCLQVIADKYVLEPGWFNYFAQMLMFDEVVIPDGKLWKRFGPLHIYIPPKEYILALKITAGRDKDLDDCAILLPQTKVKTRRQAQQLLNRYILPEGQAKDAEQIAKSLDYLFGEK